jgi:nucleoid-associated protein YgaU
MPSRNTLIWAGAAALAVVAAGAGAVVWTHPDFLEPNPADLAVARPPAESQLPPIPPPAVPVTPPPASAPPPSDTANASPLKPAFDIVNVDPSGEAVIAGRAAPNEKVELRDAGKMVAEATADASGQFVIIPPAFSAGDHSLSLAANREGQLATSNTVAVSVLAQLAKAGAGPPEAKPIVVAAIPANPKPEASALGTRTLATPAPAAGARIAIQSVETSAPGSLFAKGSAQPNTSLRLYLNQADVAEAKTQADGHWSLTIKGGMSPGSYVIQADEINPSGATVVASANTPFNYPDIPAPPTLQAIAEPVSSEPPVAPSPADPVVPSVQTKRVATGHTLWALSQSYYGDPTRYPAIVEANRAQIHNPNVIFPGQVFVVPKSDPKL